MGIAVNLVTYLGSTMHLPSSTSANIVTDFMGTSFMLCLLGGFLADTFLGRYKTIAIFSAVQALGSGMLAIATKLPQLRPTPCNASISQECEKAKGYQMGILYISLYLIALGTGGLKSSVSGFGSDQFDERNGKEKAQRTLFFSRFFFIISIGTLIAVTFLVYIQDNVGRSWGYGICSISMFIAILIFVSGTKRYRYKKVKGSPVTDIIQVIVVALRKRKLRCPSNISLLYEDAEEKSRINHTDQFHFLDKAAIIMEDSQRNKSSTPSPWTVCSVSKVEEVKMMIKLLPIWGTTIIFWTTYAQMITFSVEQASTMNRSIGNFQIPAGSLTVFFVSAILISLGIYDRIIMPIWKKWKGKPGFTSLQRISIGLVLSILGMAAAALVEQKRLSLAKEASNETSTVPLTVFLLIPQFFLVGAGEAFIYSGELDFFITESPKGMKTLSTGLFLTTLSLGFFFSSILVLIVKKVTGGNSGQGWMADNINKGRLDLFYGLVAVLSFINYGFYLLCAKWYKPNITKDCDIQENGSTSNMCVNEEWC